MLKWTEQPVTLPILSKKAKACRGIRLCVNDVTGMDIVCLSATTPSATDPGGFVESNSVLWWFRSWHASHQSFLVTLFTRKWWVLIRRDLSLVCRVLNQV